MKRPQPDIGDRLRQDFLQNVTTVKKLLRLWGTTTVDGVEVLNPRRYYHPVGDRPANYEKLFKYLGAYEDIEQNFDSKGLEAAWLYFNKNKTAKLPVDAGGNDLYSNYTTFVRDNLNKVWWDPADGAMPAGLTLTTAVVIQPSEEMAARNPFSVKIEDLIAQDLTDAALIAAIETNFSDLWQTSRITQQGLGVINKGSLVDAFTGAAVPDEDDLSPNDPWMASLARYAVGDSQVSTTIIDAAVGLNIGRKFGIAPESNVLANTVAITIEIDYYNFLSSSTLVGNVAQDLYSVIAAATAKDTLGERRGRAPSKRGTIDNSVITRQSILQMDASDLNNDITVLTRPYLLWDTASSSINTNYDSIWHTDLLKADAIRNPRNYGIKYSDLSDYLLSIVEADVRKEKVPFWKKAVAFIIFVIAFVYSGGLGAKGAVALAKAVLFASMVLSIITLVLSVAGATEWATAFAATSKALEPLVHIATIIMIIDVTTRAAETIKKEAKDKALTEVLVDMIKDEAKGMIDDIVEGATKLFTAPLSGASVNFATKLLDLVNMANNNRLSSIQSRNNDLKAEYDKLVAEGYQENDMLQGFMNVYARPATADWSMYAAQFDVPYERGGGPLALGNIQKTTKQALRKGDYDDPIFANILVT
jgi:hypothetical protein